MKYKALITLYGDYGHVHPGSVFEVPDDTGTQKRMKTLEAKGAVSRVHPAVDRKAYTVYKNKAIRPADNK